MTENTQISKQMMSLAFWLSRKYGVSTQYILNRKTSQRASVVQARRAVIYWLRDIGLSWGKVGNLLRIHHSTALNALANADPDTINTARDDVKAWILSGEESSEVITLPLDDELAILMNKTGVDECVMVDLLKWALQWRVLSGGGR